MKSKYRIIQVESIDILTPKYVIQKKTIIPFVWRTFPCISEDERAMSFGSVDSAKGWLNGYLHRKPIK